MGLIAILMLGFLSTNSGVQLSDIEHISRSIRSSFPHAASLRSEGEYEKSYSVLLQALAVSRQYQLHAYQGKCLIRIGIIKWTLGDIPGSARHFNEAGNDFNEAKDLRSKEFCNKCLELIRIYNLGKDDRKAKLYHRSIQRFEEASVLGREIGIPDLQLKCLRQQALTYLEIREFESFLEKSKKGLAIAAETNSRIEQGRCLNNIGVYYQQRNDYSQAIDCFEKALSLIQKVDDPATEAQCLNNLGLIYRELGNLTRSHHYLSGALELDRKIGDANSISMDLVNIGSLFLRRRIDEDRKGDLFQALEAFRNSLAVPGQGSADSLISFTALNNMGIILNGFKNHNGARSLFKRAMRIVERDKHDLEKCLILSNMATTYLDQQNPEAALGYFLSSYEVSSKYSFENVLVESSSGLGQCYEMMQDSDSALAYYRRAIEAIDNMRSRVSSEPLMIGFARNKLRAYERAIHILVDHYEQRPSIDGLGELFDLIEKAKARAFLESILEARVDSAAAEYSMFKERQQAISKNISELSIKLASVPVSRETELSLKNELELEEEEYIRLASEMKVASRAQVAGWRRDIRRIDDIQRLLAREEAVLLEYFLGEERSYLILISPASVRLHILPAKKMIEMSLRAYLKLISNHELNPRAGFMAAERIGRELVPRDRDESLKKATAIIVIPDGILNLLPFEALRVRDEVGSRYLVEIAAISYCPSASAFAALKIPVNLGEQRKMMLAIGGPNYGLKGPSDEGIQPIHSERPESFSKTQGIGFSQLPFSKREVQDITKLFSASAVDVLLGDAANEGNVKQWPLKDYRIIHFACHGFLNDEYPLRSALVLSQTGQPRDDGFLQMREIYGLTMNADLVVLSACQTANGVLEGSEGLMGLARPFFFAGARSVISSLWPINDKATVMFMHEFYRNLIGGSSTAEAIRYAKNKMLKSIWAHPFYWAGFMLQGDPSATRTMN